MILFVTISFRAYANSEFWGIDPKFFHAKQDLVLSSLNEILLSIESDSTAYYENDVFIYEGAKELSNLGNYVHIKKNEDGYMLKFLGQIAGIELNMGDVFHLILRTQVVNLEKLSIFYSSTTSENLFPYWLIFVLKYYISDKTVIDYTLWLHNTFANKKTDIEYEDFLRENPESMSAKNYELEQIIRDLSRAMQGILKRIPSD